ncbi:mitochondrial inner membrane protease subunit 1 isoform X2 [Mesocricetus auratus]|uniref:Mitochondrial inner membrane protease subunit n=1 Tax=Mesocricetus auratus TaxID=10036 RepID=A0ABM2XGJ0_MESAU|nr:mitochondrial inner membrane protease subunit 1 isoform X2 [Mesocricetus auratus]
MLRGVLGKTFRLAGYTIQYGCIAHCAFEYVGGVVMCSGPSMEPTIQNSDIVFAENLSRHFYGIQRGDIVIAKSPSDPKSNICKRVIGLEGDKILTTSPSDIFKNCSYCLCSQAGFYFMIPHFSLLSVGILGANRSCLVRR